MNRLLRSFESGLEGEVAGAILIAEAASAVDAFLEESGVQLTNCPAPDAEAAYARAVQKEAAALSKEYPRKEVLEAFRRELGQKKYAAYFADC